MSTLFPTPRQRGRDTGFANATSRRICRYCITQALICQILTGIVMAACGDAQ